MLVIDVSFLELIFEPVNKIKAKHFFSIEHIAEIELKLNEYGVSSSRTSNSVEFQWIYRTYLLQIVLGYEQWIAFV